MSVPKKSLALPLSHPPTEHAEEAVSQDCALTANLTGPFWYRGRGGGGPTDPLPEEVTWGTTLDSSRGQWMCCTFDLLI